MSSPIPASAAAARRLDKFYTRPEAVEACVAHLHALIASGGLPANDPSEGVVGPHDLWIEPSAGAGAFLLRLPEPRVGLDLEPGIDGIERGDFLAWSPPAGARNPIVVGNPPFGRNSSLAVRFFNHAAGFASRIAFVVPRTFEKESLQARLDPWFHLEGALPLPAESFEFLGAPYAVPSAWQVWRRRDARRSTARSPLSHPDFAFVGRDEAHFAVQRVGTRAGSVKDPSGPIAAASHYFIRAAEGASDLVESRFRQIDAAEVGARTSGNPSISKRELVALYQAVG